MESTAAKPLLVFACSGGSNVGEIADLAARKLYREGHSVMSCPTAVSARVESYLDQLKRQPQIVVLDGCETDCVAKSLENSGFKGFVHIRLNELGLLKGGALVTEENVDKVVAYAKSVLGDVSTKDSTFGYDEAADRFK